MKYSYLVSFISVLMFACVSSNPARIIDQAIQVHGGHLYERAHIEFDFRNRHYSSVRNDGLFMYTRQYTDSTGTYRDELSNDGFQRFHNNQAVDISEEWKRRYSNSVNSVLYFALLPYGLNDAAVIKTYIRQDIIEDQNYDVVQITFKKDGGGEDFEDVFYYWINTNSSTVDYLAYTYETEEAGVRFRKAINPRKVGGIRFQDYINYKPEEIVPLDSLTRLYSSGKLVELSRIILENISVKTL